jgi:hypothetical protein
MSAVIWQRIEGALVFGVALIFALYFGFGPERPALWLMALLFFAPDVAFAAYLAGPRVGAAVYNLLHLYGFGLALAALGLLAVPSGILVGLGLLWLAHAGFDRMLGYGLKEPSAFRDTHLGRIGRD